MGMNPKLWLDTGCGTGSLVEQAFDIFKETTFILADPSPEMINEAKNKLQKQEGRREDQASGACFNGKPHIEIEGRCNHGHTVPSLSVKNKERESHQDLLRFAQE